MKKLYSFKCLCLIVLMSLVCAKVKASHLYGMDLTYKHKTGNTYSITLTAYADCSAPTSIMASMNSAKPRVSIYNGASFKDSIRLVIDNAASDIEVHSCPQDVGTNCNGGSLPGMKKYTYSKDYTMPYTSQNWRFIFDGDLINSNAGRSNNITNISATASMNTVYLEAKLNNINGDNNSVNYNTVLPYYCINTLAYYAITTPDADGDNIYYALIPAKDNTGTPVTYLNPYSYPLPMHTTYFSSGSLNGIMTFKPDLQQDAVMVFEVQEYRNGVFMGSTQKESAFNVVSGCSNFPPCFATTDVPVLDAMSEVHIYPNPAKDEINVSSPEMIRTVELYNEMGQRIFSKKLSSKAFSISLKQAQFPNGVYSIAVYTEHGLVKENISVLR